MLGFDRWAWTGEGLECKIKTVISYKYLVLGGSPSLAAQHITSLHSKIQKDVSAVAAQKINPTEKKIGRLTDVVPPTSYYHINPPRLEVALLCSLRPRTVANRVVDHPQGCWYLLISKMAPSQSVQVFGK